MDELPKGSSNDDVRCSAVSATCCGDTKNSCARVRKRADAILAYAISLYSGTEKPIENVSTSRPSAAATPATVELSRPPLRNVAAPLPGASFVTALASEVRSRSPNSSTSLRAFSKRGIQYERFVLAPEASQLASVAPSSL